MAPLEEEEENEKEMENEKKEEMSSYMDWFHHWSPFYYFELCSIMFKV